MELSEQPWLNDAEKAAWVRLIAVVELLPGVLDTQLRTDNELMHFEYYVLAMLSESPNHSLQMRELASLTNATLPRLSHVVRRLEDRGFVTRETCDNDKRATNAILTSKGLATVEAAAPGHAATVRKHVFEGLNPEDVEKLTEVANAVLNNLDPEQKLAARYTRYDVPEVSEL